MRLLLSMLMLLMLLPTARGDWRQFRGTDTTSVAQNADLPTDLEAPGLVEWKLPLVGKGLSSPIVVGKQVIVTCSSGPEQQRLHVWSLDATTGKRQWERILIATGRTMCHTKTAVAAPTPCSDGQRIYATYSCNDVVCLDLAGNVQWMRALTLDYPNASNSLGMASSPVVVGDTLVVMVENDSESFTVGLSTQTGENRWRQDRPKQANWTSPAVVQLAGSTALVALQCSAKLTVHEPESGRIVSSFDQSCATIPSAAVVGDTLFVPSNGLKALKVMPGEGVPSTLWHENKLAPGTASPIVLGDQVLVINSSGVLNSAEVKTGKQNWQKRLRGPFSGSPIAADGYLYIVNETGLLQSVELTKDGKLTKLELVPQKEPDPAKKAAPVPEGELFLSTPAASDGALYIRSSGHLWKISRAAGRRT